MTKGTVYVSILHPHLFQDLHLTAYRHLHNLTKKKTKTVTIEAPAGKSLCGKSLEWIIEWSGAGLPHFDGFNSKASGKTSTGKSVNAKGSQLADVHRGGKSYCKGSVTNSGDVHFAPN